MPFNRLSDFLKNSSRFSLGRIFRRVFSSARMRGSLTVETAAVLPIFLFAFISILSVSEVIRCSDIVSQRLHQNARQMAVAAYAAGKVGLSGASSSIGSLGGIALSYTVVSSDVDRSLLKNGGRVKNVSYLRSQVMENDIIDIVAVEEMKLSCDVMGIGSFRVLDRARVHAFTGYDAAHDGALSDRSDEELVYITPTGYVYHKSRNCPHLNVTASAVAADALSGRRNSSGGKYYECEYCKRSGAQGVYYITDYGDRYHTNVNCQGLKRDVMEVPLSQVSGRSACKTCGA